jgi:Fe2+ transport system protein FeoA
MLNLIPIDLLDSGEGAEIVELEGDGAWVSRLVELGLRPGSRLRMLQPGYPCLIQVGEMRLSLRLAAVVQVLVRPEGAVAAFAASEVASCQP